jgi:hypothetical protein
MSSKNPKVSAMELKLQALKKGAQAAFPQVPLVIEGVSYNQSSFLQALDTQEAPILSVEDARRALETQLAARRASDAGRRRFCSDARAALVAALGRANPALTQFGIKPAKETVEITSAAALARAGKAKATREKNGTLGSKQKKALDEAPQAPQAPQVKP